MQKSICLRLCLDEKYTLGTFRSQQRAVLPNPPRPPRCQGGVLPGWQVNVIMITMVTMTIMIMMKMTTTMMMMMALT